MARKTLLAGVRLIVGLGVAILPMTALAAQLCPSLPADGPQVRVYGPRSTQVSFGRQSGRLSSPPPELTAPLVAPPRPLSFRSRGYVTFGRAGSSANAPGFGSALGSVLSFPLNRLARTRIGGGVDQMSQSRPTGYSPMVPPSSDRERARFHVPAEPGGMRGAALAYPRIRGTRAEQF